ncbi:aggregation-promoting factor [Streptococcus caprae]|uniref:LysM peptidoglycan-binding domain-containing protein n=1 Tax=Streptococcus caprae TaxID=1640501 RepID=A0ABV8CV21_9STRE
MLITQSKKQFALAGVIMATALSLGTAAYADSYTVQSGDTLSKIASEHQTTVESIAQLNQISNVNLISVGQILELDGLTTTTSSATSTEDSTSTSADGSVTMTTGSYTATYSAADYAAKEVIAQKESSGSYTATNGQYYGRYQLTLSYLNGDTSAENQERVADAYVANRYGSWSAALSFWNNNGWY